MSASRIGSVNMKLNDNLFDISGGTIGGKSASAVVLTV